MDMIEIGQRIRSARGERSQQEIAKASGFKQSTISAWELGKGNISVTDLFPLARGLGVPIASLLPVAGGAPTAGLSSEIQSHADRLFALLVQIYETAPNARPCVFEVIHASAEKALTWLQHAKQDIASPLPTLRLVEGPAKTGIKHPMFENLAAGHAGQVQPLDGICHVAELAERKNISLLRVQGESMVPTLRPGDVAVVQHVEPVFTLTPIRKGDKKRSLAGARAVVADGQLAVLALNDEGEAVKRIHYRGRDDDWTMLLEADNAEWGRAHGFPRKIDRGDQVTLYGQVLGLAK